jgi:primosomal protein N' (replication factor Y) (superfamily II helicase)
LYAKVIVDIKNENVNKEFDYIVPSQFETFLERGMRVIVDFNNQKRLGYVIKITNESTIATKEILEVLDSIPTIDSELFLILDELMKKSPILFSQAFETLVLNELLVSYKKEVLIKNIELIPEKFLSFFNKNNIWKLKVKDQIYYKELKRLAINNVIEIKTIIKEKGLSKVKTYYSYNDNHQYPKLNNYIEIVDLYKIKDKYLKQELIEFGISSSKINTLVKHQVLIKFDEKDYIESDITKESLNDIKLSSELDEIKNNILNSKDTFLIKSKDSQNKNNLLYKIIEQVIMKGYKVLYLVPEISLINSKYQNLSKYFDQVSLFHSGLSKGIRVNEYENIITNKKNIILGTRSSIFLPLNQLGLIIIDDEHDDAYIQSEGIYYNAKELASFRTKYHEIPLILSSHTPSVVSYYNALNHEYQLIELDDFNQEIKKPKIHLVDMKLELKNKNTSILSTQFKNAILNRIQKKEQTLIMLNKKGYSNFVLCLNCGDVPKCPKCDVSLSYYKSKNMIKCHLCGYEKEFVKTCEVCSEDKVKEIGTGIEYLEEKLKKELPNAKIFRLDKNISKTKNYQELIYQEFNNQEYDVIIGTKLISSGIKLNNLTLVGVLMADSMLKTPSYQASENTYLTLNKLINRLSDSLDSECFIQGYDLNHYAIKTINQEYQDFYNEAIYYRKLNQYTPFKNVSLILFQGLSFLKTYQKAFEIKKRLINAKLIVLGPTEDVIRKIKDYYRFTLTIKYDEIDLKEVFDLIDDQEKDDIKMKFYPNIDVR